jgi:hypothetical protein
MSNRFYEDHPIDQEFADAFVRALARFHYLSELSQKGKLCPLLEIELETLYFSGVVDGHPRMEPLPPVDPWLK